MFARNFLDQALEWMKISERCFYSLPRHQQLALHIFRHLRCRTDKYRIRRNHFQPEKHIIPQVRLMPISKKCLWNTKSRTCVSKPRIFSKKCCWWGKRLVPTIRKFRTPKIFASRIKIFQCEFSLLFKCLLPGLCPAHFGHRPPGYFFGRGMSHHSYPVDFAPDLLW